jgi:hypothetical protein
MEEDDDQEEDAECNGKAKGRVEGPIWPIAVPFHEGLATDHGGRLPALRGAWVCKCNRLTNFISTVTVTAVCQAKKR